MGSKLTAQTRRELVIALRARYAASSRIEKARILDEFTSISGYHRKSATRILNGSSELPEGVRRRPRPRLYDEAVRQALIVLWEEHQGRVAYASIAATPNPQLSAGHRPASARLSIRTSCATASPLQ